VATTNEISLIKKTYTNIGKIEDGLLESESKKEIGKKKMASVQTTL